MIKALGNKKQTRLFVLSVFFRRPIKYGLQSARRLKLDPCLSGLDRCFPVPDQRALQGFVAPDFRRLLLMPSVLPYRPADIPADIPGPFQDFPICIFVYFQLILCGPLPGALPAIFSVVHYLSLPYLTPDRLKDYFLLFNVKI